MATEPNEEAIEVKDGPHVRVALITGENEDHPVQIATTLANAKVELKIAPTKVRRLSLMRLHHEKLCDFAILLNHESHS